MRRLVVVRSGKSCCSRNLYLWRVWHLLTTPTKTPPSRPLAPAMQRAATTARPTCVVGTEAEGCQVRFHGCVAELPLEEPTDFVAHPTGHLVVRALVRRAAPPPRLFAANTAVAVLWELRAMECIMAPRTA